MAIDEQVFRDLPATPYSQARDQIRNGDIALFSGHDGMSPIIEHFTNSPFSHVGFIWRMDDIDRIMLLESVEIVGVRAIPLSSKINGGAAGKPSRAASSSRGTTTSPRPAPWTWTPSRR